MKIDVSDIIKTSGSSLNIDYKTNLDDFGAALGDYLFGEPVRFNGTLVNTDGVLELDGKLVLGFTVKCYRCLKDVYRKMNIDIEEDILNPKAVTNDESYTYKDNCVEIDKVLKDNIILNLPMKHLCKEDCKGLCEICGTDLNAGKCDCKKEEVINPRMEVLKNFFNNN